MWALDGGVHDFALVGQGAFAEAGDALVGVELHEDEVLVVAGVDEEGLQVGDLEVERLGVLEGPFEGTGLGLLRAQGAGGAGADQTQSRGEEVSSIHAGHALHLASPPCSSTKRQSWRSGS